MKFSALYVLAVVVGFLGSALFDYYKPQEAAVVEEASQEKKTPEQQDVLLYTDNEGAPILHLSTTREDMGGFVVSMKFLE